MAKTNRAYLMLGWLIGRLVMGIRALVDSEDLPPVIPDVPDEPVIPDEPVTTSMFLYGTPSDSGNIGLRSGENVTYYDGWVLSAMPKVPQGYEDYTYMLLKPGLFASSSYITAVWLHNSAYYYDGGSGYYFGGNDDNPVPAVTARYDKNSETWEDFIYHDNYNISVNKSVINGLGSFWANFDLVKKDGTVCVSATDPIPVTGIVGNSYNGIILLETPERDNLADFQYRVIDWAVMAYRLHYFRERPYVYTDDNGTTRYGSRDGCDYYYLGTAQEGANTGWTMNALYEDTAGISSPKDIRWANFDILNEDGTLYFAGSDPIPVYE